MAFKFNSAQNSMKEGYQCEIGFCECEYAEHCGQFENAKLQIANSKLSHSLGFSFNVFVSFFNCISKAIRLVYSVILSIWILNNLKMEKAKPFAFGSHKLLIANPAKRRSTRTNACFAHTSPEKVSSSSKFCATKQACTVCL